MLKRIALVAIALVSFSFASAKSYTIRISDACQAGTVQLQPGEYKVKVEGSKVILLDNRGRVIEAPAKVEQADQKFPHNSVATSRTESGVRLNWITLGGTKTRIVFED
ncbi:MAG: hypothetical protein ACUVXB_15200 [Bryobacteraceae bacterium]